MSLPAPQTAENAPRGYLSPALVGTGATSRVYRAVEEATGQPVALKRLHRQLVRSTDALTRLKRELQALSELRHPGIARVRDVIRWGGDPCIVMDFIPGEDLKERVVRLGPLPVDEVERHARALLDILATVHAAGIVHRDLKPQNIRITPEGGVVLLDFGSARLGAASDLTRTGTTVGTPEYMAPELFAGPVYDPRVDLYGVGATLFDALTGRPPHTADSLANLAYVRSHEDAPDVATLRREVSPGLRRLVNRSLQRAPEDRFPSASLAAWTLDHPDLEKGLAARRSTRPVCIHCMAPCAADAAVCPSCRSDHPFTYAPGNAHVFLSSVSNVAGFLEHLCTLFPEHASPSALERLSQRVAALSQGRQLLVAYVDQAEAHALVTELGRHGAGAEVVLESRAASGMATVGLMLPGWLFAQAVARGEGAVSMALFSGVAALAVATYPLTARSSARRARDAILSEDGSARPMAPASESALVSLGAAGGLLAALVGDLTTAVITGASFLAGAWAVARARFTAVAEGHLPSPQPGPARRFAIALRPSAHGTQVQRFVKKASSGATTALVAGAVAAGALGAEFKIIRNIVERPPIIRLPAPSPDPVPVPVVPVPAPGGGGGGGVDVGGGTHAPPPRVAPRPGEPWRWWLLMPPLVSLLVAWRARKRSRQVQEDGARIYAELELEDFRKLAARPSPLARSGLAPNTALDAVLVQPRSDAFVDEAVKRAADLARLLPPATINRLATSLEAMRRGVPASSERSLLERCISEAERGQRARFDLLLLEGQAEQEAALAWAANLEEKEK